MKSLSIVGNLVEVEESYDLKLILVMEDKVTYRKEKKSLSLVVEFDP